MTQKKTDPVAPVAVPVAVPDEDWTVAQVASHMGLSYQTARNQMLQGIFGQSKYVAKTRCLTVSANLVKRTKTKQKKRPTPRKKIASRPQTGGRKRADSQSPIQVSAVRPKVPPKAPKGDRPPATPKRTILAPLGDP